MQIPTLPKFEKTLNQILEKPQITAIGLMSGTSMDGIDVALVVSDGLGQIMRGANAEYPYDAAFKKKIEQGLIEAKQVSKPDQRTKFLDELEADITYRHAIAIKRFLADNQMNTQSVDVIGFHGQTILHRPQLGYTIQLGLGKQLAQETGIPVVYDMRSNDMVHGGQGAPLVPVFHQALAKSLPPAYRNKLPIAFVNIGGISNITYVGKSDQLIAFDSGPGNALIDQWVHLKAGIPFDQDGRIASEGSIITSLADRFLDQSFFHQKIPKSLDRNDFSPLDINDAELADGARTLAHVSAAAILKACDHLPEVPELWVVCGGGRKNPYIIADMKKLAAEKNGGTVILAEQAGLDGGAMEAEAWGYLAIRSLKKLPLTFPATTGCRFSTTGGRLVFPD